MVGTVNVRYEDVMLGSGVAKSRIDCVGKMSSLLSTMVKVSRLNALESVLLRSSETPDKVLGSCEMCQTEQRVSLR